MSLELLEKNAQIENVPDIVALEKDVHISPWSSTNFKDALSAKNIFKVFMIDNKLVGYYIALLAMNECQLLNIAIHKEYQKKGFGLKLIKNLKKICIDADISSIFLEVRVSNKNAIKLYEQSGFNELGIRKNYYKINTGWEDGVLMGAEL